MKPIFSVIIPTCHRNKELMRCLERLQIEEHPTQFSVCSQGDLAALEPRFQYEVIVTDDGTVSTAEGLIRERFPWAKWVEGPHRGPAANRNYGASLAAGDWILFVDDDCVPAAGWLQAYALAIASFPASAVFEGRTLPDGRQVRADQECPINLEGGRLWSCNLAIKRSLFFELGGFDENFPLAGMEDMDLQRRLTQAGTTVTFVPDAEAWHPWRLRRGIPFCIALAKSICCFAAKYPAAKKIFVETWGVKRVVKIFLFEFPRNLLRYRDASSFRALYLDLLTAFHVSMALARQRT